MGISEIFRRQEKEPDTKRHTKAGSEGKGQKQDGDGGATSGHGTHA
jgi:hypothetical protein